MKISIIIGCYNVANFLREKKLSCILNQTYANFEVLLVNDGSTDETLSICRELADSDSRIKVFSKENGGLGSARNMGLDSASGDYIWFYDVDDEVELNLLEVCVSKLQENNGTQMLMFGFNVISVTSKRKDTVKFDYKKYKTNEDIKQSYLDLFVNVPHGNGFNWNKMYSRYFIEEHGFRFGDNRIQQDEVFNVQFYPILDNFLVLQDVLVNYFVYASGNARSRYISNRLEIFSNVNSKLNSFNDNWLKSDFYSRKVASNYFHSFLYCIRFNLPHPDKPMTYQERLEWLRKSIDEFDVVQRIEPALLTCIEDKVWAVLIKRNNPKLMISYRWLMSLLRKLKSILLKWPKFMDSK
ncbi:MULTISPECIES: glycosyltransferase family 2 protein [unclassified Vibrio]|uniref:glycosyltransferase family 2 protein n=3 Tax=Vibrio TaxID=662 RepID=UPI001E56AA90|nr:glycosyltransferase family 2 protein [Vibrio sp. F13]MCC4892273.1 glycosyltransferase [Vibrio sp. F13]